MNAIQSVRLTEEFMELAKENTSNNLETCGILGASFVSAVGTCQCDKHTEFSVWIFIFFFCLYVEGWNLLCDNVDYTKARRNCSLSMSVVEWFQSYT